MCVEINFKGDNALGSGGTFKFLRSPGIDSARLGSPAGRYDNPIPTTRFLTPLDCSKMPALDLVRLFKRLDP